MSLTLYPVLERPDLLATCVLSRLNTFRSELPAANIFVAEIDPAHKGGEDFCAAYGVDRKDGANCVVLEAKRGQHVWYIAALVPVGYRMDIGGALRRSVNARRLSVAPLNVVLSATHMEYGSITVIGLPDTWTVLVDARVAERPYVFIGSGKVRSKLRVPGEYFSKVGQFTIMPGLGNDTV